MQASSAALSRAALVFHDKAGVPMPALSQPLAEAAHQPLFLPHKSFFDKALKASELGTCVFGFIDTDSAIFPPLYEAKIPASNVHGYDKLSFRVQNKRALFKNNPKPTLNETEAMEKAARNPELKRIIEFAFERAANAAEFNAIIIAKTAHELLGIDAAWFLYSDALAKKLFENAARELLEKPNLRDAYNTSLTASHGKIKPLAENEIPFWLECACGCHSRAFLYGKTITTECVQCGKKESHYLEDMIHLLSPKAITRNLVVPAAIGASFYVSGAGAYSEKHGNYATCAENLAVALKWKMPETTVLRHADVEEEPSSEIELEAREKEIRHKLGEVRSRESRAITADSSSERARLSREKRDLLEELDALQKKKNDVKSGAARAKLRFSIAAEL